MKRNEIHFDYFWRLKNEHLSAFNAYWQKMCNQYSPEDWPRNLTEGEWEEQFDLFIENVYNASVEKHGYYKSY